MLLGCCRKFVSCGGTIVSYFKNNKPGNCHYTPLCYFFSNKLRTNPELLFQISSEQNFLLVSADKTPLNSQYMQNLKTFNRMIKLQSPLSLWNRKTYAFVWISAKWSLWNVNCNYSVIALKLSFDISILLGYSRFQSLDIYYKASWNIVQEIKLLLLFAYFQMHLCIYAYKPYKPTHSTKIEKRCNLPMFLGSL